MTKLAPYLIRGNPGSFDPIWIPAFARLAEAYGEAQAGMTNYFMVKKTKVVVAMSGGVDSSVAAALLKKQGYDVVGVFMRFWGETRNGTDKDTEENGFNSPQPSLRIREGEEGRNTCCSEGAEQAAREVAAKLDIPFYVLRLKKEFKKAVVDYFLKEEKRGRTPNPCIVCNKKIKFGLLFEKAMALGADYIATGHYARLRREILNPKSEILNKFKIQNLKSQAICKLFKAKDNDKDQSYFLYTLTQKQLSHVLFPLGDYKKEEVYKLAKKWRLPFRQDESFDLCFVANGREGFLKKYLKMKPGKIVRFTNPPHPSFKKEGVSSLYEREGRRDLGAETKVLGGHHGLALYTIGQRKNIPLAGLPAPWQGPWWVVKKDQKKNILYVSNNEKDLYSRELLIEKINWLSGQPMKLPAKVLAKIRYKNEASAATLRPALRRRLRQGEQAQGKNSSLKVIFKKPQRAITAGQSVVFYSKTGELLGGGIIK